MLLDITFMQFWGDSHKDSPPALLEKVSDYKKKKNKLISTEHRVISQRGKHKAKSNCEGVEECSSDTPQIWALM